MTQARSTVITFCQPITQIYHSLFIKNPSGTFNYMAFIEPMHYLAWIAVILLCLSAPPFLYLTTRYNNRAYILYMLKMHFPRWKRKILNKNAEGTQCIFIFLNISFEFLVVHTQSFFSIFIL